MREALLSLVYTTAAGVSKSCAQYFKTMASLSRSVVLLVAFSLIQLASGDDYKVICYLQSWAVYWKDPNQSFGPAHIDPFACTHLIHSFIGLDNNTLTLRILDPDYEIIQGI